MLTIIVTLDRIISYSINPARLSLCSTGLVKIEGGPGDVQKSIINL